jgi:YlmC/YmxH family sporulation protein
MVKLSDMREKEVINVNNGAKIGLVYDFEIDLEKGKVMALVLPGSGRMLSFFGKNNDLVIEWEDIVKIGTDAILVDLNIEE